MNKTIKNISNQSGMTIRTLNPNPVAQAFIYSNQQRAKIVQLITHKFLPHHTSVGVGKAGKDHWRLEKYRGKFGVGFKMITRSPFSKNFSHLTYFLSIA
jgi:hypothetical protein